MIRKFPQHPLVKSDVKRPKILRDFVALVEDEFNNVTMRILAYGCLTLLAQMPE